MQKRHLDKGNKMYAFNISGAEIRLHTCMLPVVRTWRDSRAPWPSLSFWLLSHPMMKRVSLQRSQSLSALSPFLPSGSCVFSSRPCSWLNSFPDRLLITRRWLFMMGKQRCAWVHRTYSFLLVTSGCSCPKVGSLSKAPTVSAWPWRACLPCWSSSWRARIGVEMAATWIGTWIGVEKTGSAWIWVEKAAT